ncbi:ATP/GTP-binding protein [Xenophilus sp. Marseille-Q4582]|uniref:GTP-binding protein n=1 Tax=Xenophilus sp. Marseille-Q4582 TaxID=2866600 RepID=UPI001CE48F53|nr:GTPase [Xenophilus sp. Marseille-Q4582]
MSPPRIVLFGPMGIGKTTALRALCGAGSVDCDVPNLDRLSHDKATTTVGADFGIVRMEDGEELHIYGSPGQDRFGFLRQWLLSFAVGALILVDANDAGALDLAQQTLNEVQRHAPDAASVVLVARPATAPVLDRFSQALAERAGRAVPVMPVDVREREQLLDALELLAALLPE